MPTVYVWSWTHPEPVLEPQSFPVFLKKIGRTGTVGLLEPVTVWSYEPDLEALLESAESVGVHWSSGLD